MRFIAGVVVGTLFGRTILKTTSKVVPKSIREKVCEKALEKTTTFLQKRVEIVMDYADRKVFGETRRDRLIYRRPR